MLTIRLARGGAKKRPYYRIVVTEKSSRRDGRFVEAIGFSNPVASGKEETFRLNNDRYDYWYGQGAKPTPTIKRLIRSHRRHQAVDGKATAAASSD